MELQREYIIVKEVTRTSKKPDPLVNTHRYYMVDKELHRIVSGILVDKYVHQKDILKYCMPWLRRYEQDLAARHEL